MEEHHRYASGWPLAILAGCVIVPSIGVVLRYAHGSGLAVYAVAVCLILLAAERWGRPWLVRAMTERQAAWLAVAIFVLVSAAVAVLYPIANSGVLGGGSDRDEALDIGVHALLRGSYPYTLRTYLDNPISPMPGSFLLAAPFVVVLGSSGYQNVFWLAIFFLVTQHYYLKDRRESLLLLLTILGLSPAVWHEIATGGDFLANSLYVFAFAVLMTGVHTSERSRGWQHIAADVLLGIALASRANFVVVLLPVAIFIAQRAGWTYSARHVGFSAAVLTLLVLPFYLYNPAGFSPLQTMREIDRFAFVTPYAGAILAGLLVLTAVILAFRSKHLDRAKLLFHCALPQSVPVILGLVALASAGARVITGTPASA